MLLKKQKKAHEPSSKIIQPFLSFFNYFKKPSHRMTLFYRYFTRLRETKLRTKRMTPPNNPNKEVVSPVEGK